MGEKQTGYRVKKFGIAFLVLTALLLVSGCETAKGVACGAYYGARKDMKNAAQADVWLRENLW